MYRRLRIAPRLTLLVALGGGLVLGATAWQGSLLAEQFLRKELEAKASALAVATANDITSVERAVATAAAGLAASLEELDPATAQVQPLIESVLRACPRAYGMAVAAEPGPGRPRSSPYVYRSGDRMVRIDLADGGYNYEMWDWYVLPKELRRAVWTEPYFDEGAGNILMATYSVPLMRRDANPGFRGVATCDLSLEWLSGLLKSLPLGEAGYAFLLSPSGTVIAHPEAQYVMSETIFSIAAERHSPELRELGKRMIRGESGFAPFPAAWTGKPSWIAYRPVPGTGWSVGVVFPQESITEKVSSLRRRQLEIGMLGFAVLVGLAGAIARSITRPLHALETATNVVATGHLEAALPQPSGDDEVAHLAAAFARMQVELREFVEKLRVTTAARERIQRELEIAHGIQMALVPKTFPPYPQRPEIDVYAILEPAKEVGGDFYDLFLIDDDHFCIAIGDVSGKGVPAALFMAVTRTLFKSLAYGQDDPAHVLSRLNRELAQGNDTGMFVTLFCAIIDLHSGEVRYANGGHNPPFLLRRDGGAEKLPLPKGLLLGVFETAPFEERRLVLRPGDALFLYTDGVTEALSPTDELMGDERARLAVERCHGFDCRQIVESVCSDVAAFRAEAEQSDDITALAFVFQGPAPSGN